MLSFIADEYETMGDYIRAEESWNKCCALVNHTRSLYLEYVSKKGDFLYRTGQWEKAIGTYEEALKVLNGADYRSIKNIMLRHYARITHFIIASYKELGFTNQKEKYHRELKHGIDRFIRSNVSDDETKAYRISETAWQLYIKDGMPDETLILMDLAIELHPNCPANDYNRKAIILEYDFKYEEALKYYDKALSKDGSNETFLKNRAICEAECIKKKLDVDVIVKQVKPRHLDLINKALKILPSDMDNAPYLKTKSQILNLLGEPVKAKICYKLAYKCYDEVDKAEKQLKKLKPNETYINITGTGYYQNFTPFKEGTVVDLIKEKNNPDDMNAIRVEIEGKTVGYVANSKYTLIKEVKSATEIRNARSWQAEVQFILLGEWVIAKLI